MAKKKLPAHQFGLFSFSEIKPKLKVPISKERVEEAKRLIAQRDGKNAAIVLRDIRQSLESFERRLK